MVDTIFFVDEILKKIEFFSGIPDSLLKDFNQCIMDKCTSKNHIIPANEGSAVSLAAGYYLSKDKIPMVYMQNSGIGNSLNPLISLLDKYVYDLGSCTFCQMCVTTCPHHAIKFTNEFEHAVFRREKLVKILNHTDNPTEK